MKDDEVVFVGMNIENEKWKEGDEGCMCGS